MIDNVTPADPLAARHINAFEKLRDPSHNWEYSPTDWKGFFAAAGFEVTHLETFRKAMDFDAHCDRMSVPPHTRQQLRVMLRHAPAAAHEALTPEFAGDRITFYLAEVLIVARRAE